MAASRQESESSGLKSEGDSHWCGIFDFKSVAGRRPAEMGRAYSDDLRERVTASISGPDRSSPAGLHPRDLGPDQHDPAARLVRRGASWSARCRTVTGARSPSSPRSVATASTRPLVLGGPINSQSFTACVEQFLLSTLSPGDAVVPVNLGSHKGKAVRQLIRSAGARLLFLPPYSPRPEPDRAGLRRARRCRAKPTVLAETTWR